MWVIPDSVAGLENDWANTVAFSDWARAHNAPRLDSYRVAPELERTPTPLDLASYPGARRFRTVLRNGARRGPNFAGHYTVVSWGCGSPCTEFVIVNGWTGKIVYWTDEPLVRPPIFARWSRLMADDPTGFMTDSAGRPHFATVVRYYEWTGHELLLRDTIDAAEARIKCCR